MLRSLALKLLLPFASVVAQVDPAPAGPPRPDQVLTANERFVYVLRGDRLLQFDATTLVLLNTTRLPTEADLQREASRQKLTADEPRAEPDASERTAGAGGRFGGRQHGREQLARNPRNAASANSISKGLEWLKAHQDDDGRWDADGFMKHDSNGAMEDGAGRPTHDIGVTGLALLAFLGDGSSLQAGPYREQIRRGVEWLTRQQGENGLIGSNQDYEFIYGHAIATLALTEAYGLSQEASLKQAAQQAIDYLESHRNPGAVWRYQPRDGDNDTSVTTWCVLAYRSAKDFQLKVNEGALRDAAAWYDRMTDPETGRTGYTERGSVSARRPGDHSKRFPVELDESMTAGALFARFLLGQTPKTHPVMQRSADLLVARPPVWNPNAGTIHHYGWYFGTYALYQMGGRHWRAWQRHLEKALVRTQDEAGSWAPLGVWGETGGRVYSTALSTLTLEAYYRYTRLVR